MPNKPKIDLLIDNFQGQVDELYQHIDAVLWVWGDRKKMESAGFPVLDDRNLERVYESSLVEAVVAWQLFVADWFRMALVRDSSVLRKSLSEVNRRPELKVRGVRLFPEMKPLTAHPSMESIAALIESQGQFFDVNSQSAWRAYSKLLAPGYATRAGKLTKDDFLVVELCRRLRNASAHRSSPSLMSVREMITGNELKDFDRRHGKVSLSREHGLTERGIGRYLAAEMACPP
ncbi:hypothetical protein AAFP30_28680 [Gordonia sp. CPCC 205515]|uniref:hypothetical protein n=1 Tax=Gordonia sp. CPCC 205515 TaxID=3140791 RepID=UPI003AF36A43